MQTDPVHTTLRNLGQRLDAAGVPYAVVGGMAPAAHGYARTTVDVDVLATPAGLERTHQELAGRGYLPPFNGSRNLRDTATGVRVVFEVTGQFPGDGRPKPVAFPDPAAVATAVDAVQFAALPTLVELKLASGISNPGRLRDLADVQELIRVRRLPREFAEQLNPYVRTRFVELWEAVQGEPAD